MFTLANSVSDIIEENSREQKQPKNYYLEYLEESYEYYETYEEIKNVEQVQEEKEESVEKDNEVIESDIAQDDKNETQINSIESKKLEGE